MRLQLLDLLVCPACRHALDCAPATLTDRDDIQEGQLSCSVCGTVYPIRRGIPRFVPSENYAASFGYQWNKFRQEQIDALNGTRQSEDRLRAETGWTPEWTAGKWLLDAGCGAGRFLEVSSRVADCQCVGVDLSNAIDAAQETVAGRPNVHLVQASIFALPFRSGTFDAVYCIGVIQHTPDPSRAVSALAAMVRAGGRIALTIYERRPLTPLYTKYWLRPLTRRLSGPALLRLIRLTMPAAFAVTEVLFRIPLLGRGFQFLIPVANYIGAAGLSMRQRYQWAILDTFDMFAPAYDSPQRERDVTAGLSEGGIDGIARLPNPGLNLVGTKATTAAAVR